VVLPLAVLAHGVLSRTVLGRWLYAVGGNARAARVSGVPVERVLLLAYAACGACAGLAAVLYTARLETGSPVLGQRIFLDVIGGAVIGGSSLFGGRGTVRGTAFGVLFISLVDNSLNLLGLSSFTVLMVKGGVILAAAVLDAWRERVAGR
jgi:ribose/xylose/arabinose/galactoside ABC-type transport system permease subunit